MVRSLRALAMARVPWSLELQRSGESIDFVVALENEYLQEKKEANRLLLFKVINSAFYHGDDIRDAKRGADILFAALGDWASSGFRMKYVVDILASKGLQVTSSTAHVIGSSVCLWRAFPDQGRYTYMTSDIVGQLCRSDMVDNREGILGRWEWTRPPTRELWGESSTPIIVSLVEDRLFDPVDLHSVVEGVAMLPNDVRRYFRFHD
jgi:hypothetical protein